MRQGFDLDDLLEMADANARICPVPSPWEELWRLLPEKNQVGGTWIPRPPPIVGDWWVMSREEKRERFRAHLRYATAKGVAHAAGLLLSSLKEDEWLHEE
ncbi:MAG TPA: hypothetical protein VL354_12090 [Spirochaetia bacterium]|nr:hypothetical protein [Spirochaetia bacterium]